MQLGKHASMYSFWVFLAYICIYIYFCFYHLWYDDVGKNIYSHVQVAWVDLRMLDAMKTHETLWKLKEKLGKYERLGMIKMENFKRIENVKTMWFWVWVVLENIGLNGHRQI